MKKFKEFNPHNMDVELREEFYCDLISLGKNGVYASYFAIFAAFPTAILAFDGDIPKVLELFKSLGIWLHLYLLIITLIPVLIYREGYSQRQKLRCVNNKEKQNDEDSSEI